MKGTRTMILLSLTASSVFSLDCSHASMTPTPASSTPTVVRTTTTTTTTVPVDTLGALRQRAVSALLQRIAGRENAPAESVFQNVRLLKGVPAGRFLEIMNDGFGHGLGVGCGFCHVPGQWASDDKPNKTTARDMLQMVNRINTDLRGMSNLPDPQPMIGCITCHRMAAKPVLIGTR
jgi:hypothetical protein